MRVFLHLGLVDGFQFLGFQVRREKSVGVILFDGAGLEVAHFEQEIRQALQRLLGCHFLVLVRIARLVPHDSLRWPVRVGFVFDQDQLLHIFIMNFSFVVVVVVQIFQFPRVDRPPRDVLVELEWNKIEWSPLCSIGSAVSSCTRFRLIRRSVSGTHPGHPGADFPRRDE